MIDSLWYRRDCAKHPVTSDDMIAAIDTINPKPFKGDDLRRWPAPYLHFAQRTGNGLSPFNQAVVAAEVERLKAWDAPAAASAAIATFALVVAIAALVVTITRPPANRSATASCSQGAAVVR